VFYGSAGTRLIFIFRKWCRPEFHWYPTLSAEKSGQDGARKSTAKAKILYKGGGTGAENNGTIVASWPPLRGVGKLAEKSDRDAVSEMV